MPPIDPTYPKPIVNFIRGLDSRHPEGNALHYGDNLIATSDEPDLYMLTGILKEKTTFGWKIVQIQQWDITKKKPAKLEFNIKKYNRKTKTAEPYPPGKYRLEMKGAWKPKYIETGWRDNFRIV